MTPHAGLSSITLYAADMNKTVRFYQALGINLEASGSWSGYVHYLACLTGFGTNQFLEVHSLKSGQTVSPQGLGFEVENVPEVLLNLLALGAPVTRKPASEKLYQYATHITARDPDGRTVRIRQRDKNPA